MFACKKRGKISVYYDLDEISHTRSPKQESGTTIRFMKQYSSLELRDLIVVHKILRSSQFTSILHYKQEKKICIVGQDTPCTAWDEWEVTYKNNPKQLKSVSKQ